MKFSAVLAFIAAATVVSASTNAERFARGLGPKAPARRATPVDSARRGYPSGTPPSQCSSGTMQCCDSTYSSDSSFAQEMGQLLGITIPIVGDIGLDCSPLSVLGLKRGTCTQQTVCCENNEDNALIFVGCNNINL